jgi:hypothetical protein
MNLAWIKRKKYGFEVNTLRGGPGTGLGAFLAVGVAVKMSPILVVMTY